MAFPVSPDKITTVELYGTTVVLLLINGQIKITTPRALELMESFSDLLRVSHNFSKSLKFFWVI